MRVDPATAGWVLFSASGVLFLISGFRAGDWFTIVGSVLWLIGVGFFLLGRSRFIN